ncbi:TlpA family protein disulfide reductase [Candidatus Thioglobus sp.]|jgi:thiol-disulfide isomerase/thioredoxin|nr:TlpA family protein disulfide reductase [Candidatus Thioglobus sp.]MDC1450025.1 TlpA family protein disulfide reductase [Candidatus Thioglobus sp.]
MKKILIILWLITPFHASQALSFNDIVDWAKPLMPWYESVPELSFSLTDTKGVMFTEKNTRGKYLVINFWATWCTPCLKEIPAFVKFYEENSDHVEILGLDFEPVDLEIINDYVGRFSINYPIVLYNEDNDSEYSNFGEIVGMPTTQIYSPEGELLHTFMGEITIDDLSKFIVPTS